MALLKNNYIFYFKDMYHIVYILVIYALGCEWYIAGGQIG